MAIGDWGDTDRSSGLRDASLPSYPLSEGRPHCSVTYSSESKPYEAGLAAENAAVD